METWKYLLHDKLGLSHENMEKPENYAGVKKAYDTCWELAIGIQGVDVSPWNNCSI